MAKYVYLSFIKWKPDGGSELYADKIRPRLENEEVEMIHHGWAYGVSEDTVMIHRTDLDIDAFTTLRNEACTVDGKNWIDYARTIISTTFKT